MNGMKMTKQPSEKEDSTGNNSLCIFLQDHLRYRGMIRYDWICLPLMQWNDCVEGYARPMCNNLLKKTQNVSL